MHRMLLIFVFAIASSIVLADGHEPKKAVLVTGASSGIGYAIARKLAENGFHVYAGARKDVDIERLDAMPNISAVRLDVTVPADIAAATRFVSSQGRELWGVVNNAGVGVQGPMTEMKVEDIDWVFDVNVYGPHRINNAFAAMLEESGGRTTTIGSIAGYISRAGLGVYAMSKFAIEGYTDAYALEMAEKGVHVSVIEPGGFRSHIREKFFLNSLGGKTVADLSSAEREQLERLRAEEAAIKEPDEVAEAALLVMTAESPKRRYMVTPNVEQAMETIKAALGKVAQLNRDQAYTFSREELVELLDKALIAEY